MKKLLISIIACASVTLMAQDNVGPQNGVVKNLQLSRWNVRNITPDSPTAAAYTTTTNVVSATAAMIGKIICYPGAVNDSLTLYNAPDTPTFVAASTTVAGGQKALELFKWTATSGTTSANSPTYGVPYVFDLMPGLWASSGIVAVASGSASTTTRDWIMYDNRE